jgi:peptide/nickel transport system substrate-binding protein
MVASLKTRSSTIARTAAWIGPEGGAGGADAGAPEGVGDASGEASGETSDSANAVESATKSDFGWAIAQRIANRCTTKARVVERVFALAVAIVSPGCTEATHDAAGGASGRPLEVLVTSDPETLDPRYVTDAVGMRMTRLVHAGLTRVDATTLRPVPYLAESLRWSSPLTLEVTLRQGLRFHGGAPFTSEDVVATLGAFASKTVASRHASTVEPIESVVATGPYELRVVLRRPHASLLADFDLPILRHDQASSPPDPSGMSLDGLGPFEVEATARGETRLTPAHFGVMEATPAHARVAIRTVHDENARAIRLYSGHADVAQSVISPTLLPALDGRAGLTVVTARGANLTYLVCRVDRGPLADVRLRRALSLAVDRKTLTEALLSHRATPATTILPQGHWAAPPTPPPLRFDPAAARNLVGSMDAPPPRLTLLTSTDRLRMTIARTMAEELGAAGIPIEVVPLELGTLLARLNAGEFDLASLALPELTEPNVLRVFLHSAYIPPAGSNRGRVRDKELDALLDMGDAEEDLAKRAAVYGRLEERLAEALFIIPLWHEDQVAVVSERAKGYAPSPDGRWLSLASLQ